MTEEIRVIIADDHPLYRDGVARTLNDAEGVTVLDQVGSAPEAETSAARHSPDIALLDISMPGNGIRAIQRILARRPETKVVILTVSETDDDVHAAFEAGAHGYILKGIGGDELVRVIRGMAAGDAYVSPSLAARLLREQLGAKCRLGQNGIDQLTKREEDILRLVALGCSNREAGDHLGLQEKTVKHYMTAIMQKLPARNRVEAAMIAQRAWD